MSETQWSSPRFACSLKTCSVLDCETPRDNDNGRRFCVGHAKLYDKEALETETVIHEFKRVD